MHFICSHQFLERIGKGEAVSHCYDSHTMCSLNTCVHRYLPSVLISYSTSLQTSTPYGEYGDPHAHMHLLYPHYAYNRHDNRRHSGMLFQTDSDLKLDG